MTTDEKIDLLITEVQGMKSEMQGMKAEMQGMKSEMQGMKADIQGIKTEMQGMKTEMHGMKEDIAALKRTASLFENDTMPKVQVLLENHADLAKNVMVAKGVEERVGVLEFDVKVIKQLLKKQLSYSKE